MRKNKNQTGNVHAAIIVILVIVLVGALGFVFWKNFLKKDISVSQTESKTTNNSPCSMKENVAAEDGTFCSKEMGVKFTVPSIFANKLTKVDNYEVFQGPLEPSNKVSVGFSENVFKGIINGKDNFTFTIAQEPLRSGYIGVNNALRNTYYDQNTGELTMVTTPTSSYDSATNTFITSGTYSKGEIIPSFDVGDVHFFKGSDGDAGQLENTYVGVVNNKIIKISLKNVAYIGPAADDPTTIDASKVFDELDKSIRILKVIKP